MMGKNQKKLVYIGCGHDRMKDFIHIEINLSKNKAGMPDIVADIGDYIPFKDNSVDFIFSKDTLEHLTYAELLNCLLESHRILKRGGYIRMVVPDFDKMIRDYFNKVHDPNMQSPGNPNETYTDTFIGRVMYFDHKYLHNFDTLSRALGKAGFEEIRECKPGDSNVVEAKEELLKRELDAEKREIILEAVKTDKQPIIEKNRKKYPSNSLLYFLAKFFNIKITAHTERKARFPHRYWFKTLLNFNKNKDFN